MSRIHQVFATALVVCIFGLLLSWKHNLLDGQESKDQPTQATAPDEILARRIQDLKEGESGYIMPEALVVDLEKKVWINKNFSLSDIDTQVTLKSGKTGLQVEVSNPGIKWLPVELVDVSSNYKRIFLPVSALKVSMPLTQEEPKSDPRPKVKPAPPKEKVQ